MQLAAARFLVGLGCAGSYTAGIVVISRWFAKASWSTLISWQFALGPDRTGAGGHAAGGRRRLGGLALPVRGHGARRHARRLPVPAGRARRSAGRAAAVVRPGACDKGRRAAGPAPGALDARAGAGVLPVHGRLRLAGDRAGGLGRPLPPRRLQPRHGGARQRAPRHGPRADGGRAGRRPAGPSLQHAQMGLDRFGVPGADGDDRAGAGTAILECGRRLPVPAERLVGLWRGALRPDPQPVSGPPRRTQRHHHQHGTTVRRLGAADAHRLHPAAVSPPGARLLAARLPVHLCDAGLLPCRGARDLPHRQGHQAAARSPPPPRASRAPAPVEPTPAGILACGQRRRGAILSSPTGLFTGGCKNDGSAQGQARLLHGLGRRHRPGDGHRLRARGRQGDRQRPQRGGHGRPEGGGRRRVRQARRARHRRHRGAGQAARPRRRAVQRRGLRPPRHGARLPPTRTGTSPSTSTSSPCTAPSRRSCRAC